MRGPVANSAQRGNGSRWAFGDVDRIGRVQIKHLGRLFSFLYYAVGGPTMPMQRRADGVVGYVTRRIRETEGRIRPSPNSWRYLPTLHIHTIQVGGLVAGLIKEDSARAQRLCIHRARACECMRVKSRGCRCFRQADSSQKEFPWRPTAR